MTAVSNAGPVIALGKLGLLHIFRPLYGAVQIPAAVHAEVVTAGLERGEPDAHAAQLALARGGLVVVSVASDEVAPSLRALALAEGERQAIHLALKQGTDWLLLDDLLARQAARRLGLRVKGTLGVIVDAERTGVLSPTEVDVTMQAIISRSDIWIGEPLVRLVWQTLRERRSG